MKEKKLFIDCKPKGKYLDFEPDYYEPNDDTSAYGQFVDISSIEPIAPSINLELPNNNNNNSNKSTSSSNKCIRTLEDLPRELENSLSSVTDNSVNDSRISYGSSGCSLSTNGSLSLQMIRLQLRGKQNESLSSWESRSNSRKSEIFVMEV